MRERGRERAESSKVVERRVRGSSHSERRMGLGVF
jgi:hypothetical protein